MSQRCAYRGVWEKGSGHGYKDPYLLIQEGCSGSVWTPVIASVSPAPLSYLCGSAERERACKERSGRT